MRHWVALAAALLALTGTASAQAGDGGGYPPGVALAESPLHRATPGPPPRAGEELCYRPHPVSE